MVSPPYRYLKRSGDNENQNLNIGTYDIIADIHSGNCVITNAISSNKIKVTTIVNDNFSELTDGSTTALHSHAAGAAAPGGSFTANIGSDYTYGISGVQFVSSQKISGGLIKGNWVGNSIGSNYITGYIASSTATGRFADSSNIRFRFPASSIAITRYADSSNIRYRFVASSLSLERYNKYVGHSGNTFVHVTTGLSSNIYASIKHSANTGLHSFNVNNYITSTNAISRFAPSSLIKGYYYPSSLGKSLMNFSANKSLYANSSNVRFRFIGSAQALAKFAPSKSIANGLQTIIDGYGTIAHGLITTPYYWNVRPSGSVNFGITTKVDATNIYVYLTAFGSRGVYWYAST